MNIINLPISLGEALDKLTILDIKMEKIKDNRLDDVKKEYLILYEKLKKYIDNFSFYYKILKQINHDIWVMQDDFRYNNGDKIKLCFKIIKDNDRRFRVKKKINDLTNSSLKEQKGYKPRKALVLTHLGLGDNITAIGMVRYLSTCYDEVLVVCKTNNKKNVELFYSDDNSIKIIDYKHDKYISPKYGINLQDKFNNYDLFLCGQHDLEKKYKSKNGIPYNFYEQVNIDPLIFWKYFYIPNLQLQNELYDLIKDIKYIFIHNTSSNGQVFSIRKIEGKYSLNKNNILFINPNKNIYDKNHKFYELANKFIGHKLIYYKKIIENAEYNFFSDSSFFCMAINLNILTNNNYYYSRSINYDHLYNTKLFPKYINKKKFMKL